MNWQIADALPDDAAEIATLFGASRSAAMPWLPVLHDETATRQFFAGVITASTVRVVRDGTLRGFCARRSGWIDHLYVAPTAHRRGIGAALLADALTESRDVSLWTFQRNSAARGFYRRFGFAEIELTDGTRNEEREPDVLLRWTAA